jgi:tetratricopeptide (TPR) repeat protein
MEKCKWRLWGAQSRGDQHATRAAAREIVDLFGGDPAVGSGERGILAEAHEVLEDWDKAIELTRAEAPFSPGYAEETLLRLLGKAGRLDEIESIMTNTISSKNGTHAAVLLIATERVDKAFEFLSKQLEENRNYADACIGLAMIHFERKEFAESDAMMERAIALRPSPSRSAFFPRTITYWLDRGQPEKARTWLRESARNYPLRWEYEGLFEWAAQFPELETTVRELTKTDQSGQD